MLNFFKKLFSAKSILSELFLVVVIVKGFGRLVEAYTYNSFNLHLDNVLDNYILPLFLNCKSPESVIVGMFNFLKLEFSPLFQAYTLGNFINIENSFNEGFNILLDSSHTLNYTNPSVLLLSIYGLNLLFKNEIAYNFSKKTNQISGEYELKRISVSNFDTVVSDNLGSGVERVFSKSFICSNYEADSVKTLIYIVNKIKDLVNANSERYITLSKSIGNNKNIFLISKENKYNTLASSDNFFIENANILIDNSYSSKIGKGIYTKQSFGEELYSFEVNDFHSDESTLVEEEEVSEDLVNEVEEEVSEDLVNEVEEEEVSEDLVNEVEEEEVSEDLVNEVEEEEVSEDLVNEVEEEVSEDLVNEVEEEVSEDLVNEVEEEEVSLFLWNCDNVDNLSTPNTIFSTDLLNNGEFLSNYNNNGDIIVNTLKNDGNLSNKNKVWSNNYGVTFFDESKIDDSYLNSLFRKPNWFSSFNNIYNNQTTNSQSSWILGDSKPTPKDSLEFSVSVLNEVQNDIYSSTYGRNGAWDFICPSTLEFRGIVELYGLVMFILFSIFLVLFSLSFFALLFGNDSIQYRILRDTRNNFTNLYKFGNLPNFIYNKNKKTVYGSRFIYNYYIKMLESNLPQQYWVYFSNLEFLWTLIPCIILLFISVPSFTLALSLDESHKPSTWIKIIGNQWYWIYEYGCYENQVIIYSNINTGSDLLNNSLRLYETDNLITIKENEHTRLLVTSTDVIHSWTVPTMGIKVDACPGRINAVTILPTRSGIYYGQCSELCGVNHAFMPICVEVVK